VHWRFLFLTLLPFRESADGAAVVAELETLQRQQIPERRGSAADPALVESAVLVAESPDPADRPR
jgi:hypothetical protein